MALAQHHAQLRASVLVPVIQERPAAIDVETAVLHAQLEQVCDHVFISNGYMYNLCGMQKQLDDAVNIRYTKGKVTIL